MKRWLIAAAILLGLLVPAVAFWQSRDSNYNQNIVASGGGSNVTVDQIGSTIYASNTASISNTVVTISTGLTNPALVCAALRAHASNDVTAGITASWGGQTMTLIKAQNAGANTNAVFLFGLRAPSTGSHTVTLAGTNLATDNFANCVSFSNVNQTSDAAAFPNPTGTTGTTTLTVTSANGHIVFGANDFLLTGNVNLGTTVIFDESLGIIISAYAEYVASSGATAVVGSANGKVMNALAGMDISN